MSTKYVKHLETIETLTALLRKAQGVMEMTAQSGGNDHLIDMADEIVMALTAIERYTPQPDAPTGTRPPTPARTDDETRAKERETMSAKVDYVNLLRSLNPHPDELTGKVWIRPEVARAIASELQANYAALATAERIRQALERERGLRIAAVDVIDRAYAILNTPIPNGSDYLAILHQSQSEHTRTLEVLSAFVKDPLPADDDAAPTPPAPAQPVAPVWAYTLREKVGIIDGNLKDWILESSQQKSDYLLGRVLNDITDALQMIAEQLSEKEAQS